MRLTTMIAGKEDNRERKDGAKAAQKFLRRGERIGSGAKEEAEGNTSTSNTPTPWRKDGIQGGPNLGGKNCQEGKRKTKLRRNRAGAREEGTVSHHLTGKRLTGVRKKTWN